MPYFTRGDLQEISAGVRPSAAYKVVTFSNAANLGALNSVIPLFTVTGGILCSLRGYVETTLAGASATLVHGVPGTTNMLIPIQTCTNMTTRKGVDSTGVVARGTALAKTPLWYVQDEVISATDATAAITAGKVHYFLDYIALTPGALVE